MVVGGDLETGDVNHDGRPIGAHHLKDLGGELVPVTAWHELRELAPSPSGSAKARARSVLSVPRGAARLPGGERAVSVLLALGPQDELTPELVGRLETACRADSEGAPASHREAVSMDEASGTNVWVSAEGKELSNHARNQSWTTVRVIVRLLLSE